MKKNEEVLILDTKKIASDTIEMTLQHAQISKTAKPGQFLHISVPNRTLRRPISIAAIDQEKEEMIMIFKIVGKGTLALANLKTPLTLNDPGRNSKSEDQ